MLELQETKRRNKSGYVTKGRNRYNMYDREEESEGFKES